MRRAPASNSTSGGASCLNHISTARALAEWGGGGAVYAFMYIPTWIGIIMWLQELNMDKGEGMGGRNGEDEVGMGKRR